MILSHRHRFVFIHCRKTAGSSICVSLARSLGPSDLQLSGIVETLEHGIGLTDRVQKEARQSSISLAARSPFVNQLRLKRAISRAIKDRYRPTLGPRPQHATARQIATVFPEEWSTYRTFCVVRNPWDKTVSDYFWRTRESRRSLSLSEYVRALSARRDLEGVVPVPFHSNWDMYTLDGRVAVDYVVRYEYLVAELGAVCSTLGISWDGWLPRAKGSTRRRGEGKHDYREMYDDQTRRAVGELYQREIDEFHYEF